MTLTGSTDKPQYMGVYKRSEKTAHDAPVFVKKADVNTYYLYRYANGKWKATDDEEKFAKGYHDIELTEAADLPSEAGLTWDDPAVTCTAVRETRHEHSHAYPLHPDLLFSNVTP